MCWRAITTRIFAVVAAFRQIALLIWKFCTVLHVSAIVISNVVSHNYKVNYNTWKTYHINSYFVNITNSQFNDTNISHINTHHIVTLHHVIPSALWNSVVAPSGELMCSSSPVNPGTHWRQSRLLSKPATNRQQLECDSLSRSTLSPTRSTLLPILSILCRQWVSDQSDAVDFVDFQQSRPCWIQLCRQCVPGLTVKNWKCFAGHENVFTARCSA